MNYHVLPEYLPCAYCGGSAHVIPIVIQFENADIVPLICPHCLKLMAIRERVEGVFSVEEPSLDGSEIILAVLEDFTRKELLRQTPSNKSRWN